MQFTDLQSTNFPSYNDTSLTNYQFTPRIKNITKIFNKNLESLIGLDIQYADYKSYRKKNEESIPLHVYDAWQTTQSLYTQQSFKISKKNKTRSWDKISDKQNWNFALGVGGMRGAAIYIYIPPHLVRG